MAMQTPAAVIFDCDGVLVDTDVVIRVSKASLTRREGGDRDDESDDAVAEVTDLTDGAEASDEDSSPKSSKSARHEPASRRGGARPAVPQGAHLQPFQAR